MNQPCRDVSPPSGIGSYTSLDSTLLSEECPHLDLVSCVVGILQSDVSLRRSSTAGLGPATSRVAGKWSTLHMYY